MASSPDRLFPAVILRLLSVMLFTVMNVLIKSCERQGASFGEILFYRQFGAALLVTGILVAGPGIGMATTRRLPAHLLRAVVGLCAMCCTFAAVIALPLAEATTIGSPCRSSPPSSVR